MSTPGGEHRHGAVVALLATLFFLAPSGFARADGTDDCPHWTVDPSAPEPVEFYLPTPDPDPFYAQPSPMPCVPRGTLLDSREVAFSPSGIPLPPHRAWHLKYLSTGSHGEPIAAIATVVKPVVSVNPPPAVVYFSVYESLGVKCAPSRQLTGRIDSLHAFAEGLVAIEPALSQGWTLIVPDYQGPHSAMSTTPFHGKVSLDAVRAAKSFGPLGIEDSPVGLWGGSTGGGVALWTASLQPSHAPELVLACLATFAPMVDPGTVNRNFDGHSELPLFVLGVDWFHVGLSNLIGTERAFPGFLPEENLTEKGRAMVEATRDGCTGWTTDGSPIPMGTYADYFVTDPLATPFGQEISARAKLPQEGFTPVIPEVFIRHSRADELQPVEGVDALVDAWCDAGVDVTYDRTPLLNHSLTYYTNALAPDMLLFLHDCLGSSGSPSLVSPIHSLFPTVSTCD